MREFNIILFPFRITNFMYFNLCLEYFNINYSMIYIFYEKLFYNIFYFYLIILIVNVITNI